MTLNPLDLLRQLGSGVRPESTARPASSIDSTGFAELLDRARGGEFSSRQPLTIDPAAGVALTSSQMDRLQVAIDASEAAGHTRVLALIDGKALSIDVASRTITESHAPSDARFLTGFDAVINVPDLGLNDLRSLLARQGRNEPERSPLDPLRTLRNRSLSDLVNQPTT